MREDSTDEFFAVAVLAKDFGAFGGMLAVGGVVVVGPALVVEVVEERGKGPRDFRRRRFSERTRGRRLRRRACVCGDFPIGCIRTGASRRRRGLAFSGFPFSSSMKEFNIVTMERPAPIRSSWVTLRIGRQAVQSHMRRSRS